MSKINLWLAAVQELPNEAEKQAVHVLAKANDIIKTQNPETVKGTHKGVSAQQIIATIPHIPSK